MTLANHHQRLSCLNSHSNIDNSLNKMTVNGPGQYMKLLYPLSFTFGFSMITSVVDVANLVYHVDLQSMYHGLGATVTRY